MLCAQDFTTFYWNSSLRCCSYNKPQMFCSLLVDQFQAFCPSLWTKFKCPVLSLWTNFKCSVLSSWTKFKFSVLPNILSSPCGPKSNVLSSSRGPTSNVLSFLVDQLQMFCPSLWTKFKCFVLAKLHRSLPALLQRCYPLVFRLYWILFPEMSHWLLLLFWR